MQNLNQTTQAGLSIIPNLLNLNMVIFSFDHHAMLLWKEEKRGDLVNYLRENELLDHVPYWKLAQALFEVMPRDEEDWKLISSLLGERETLRLEAKRSEQPKQQSMLDS